MVTTREAILAAEQSASDLEEAARVARRRAKELRREGYIEEPEDGGVLRFAVQFGAITYNYAAIRTGGKWYTTGAGCPKDGYGWEALFRFIDRGELIGMVEIMEPAE